MAFRPPPRMGRQTTRIAPEMGSSGGLLQNHGRERGEWRRTRHRHRGSARPKSGESSPNVPKPKPRFLLGNYSCVSYVSRAKIMVLWSLRLTAPISLRAREPLLQTPRHNFLPGVRHSPLPRRGTGGEGIRFMGSGSKGHSCAGIGKGPGPVRFRAQLCLGSC
jgi:hypothetical protein